MLRGRRGTGYWGTSGGREALFHVDGLLRSGIEKATDRKSGNEVKGSDTYEVFLQLLTYGHDSFAEVECKKYEKAALLTRLCTVMKKGFAYFLVLAKGFIIFMPQHPWRAY